MPALVVSGAAVVTVRWSHLGVPMFNVMGALVAGATSITQGLANTLDAAIKAAYGTTLSTHQGGSTALVSVGLRDIRTANQAEFIGTGAFAAGTGPGDILPRQNAVCVTLRTALSGQRFRGRVYLGGFTETDNDSTGSIGATLSTASVNFVTAISTSLSTNGLTLGVLSRPAERQTIVTTTFHGDGTSSVDTVTREARGGTITPVTSIAVRNAVWDSQRRRAAAGTASTLFGVQAQSFIGADA